MTTIGLTTSTSCFLSSAAILSRMAVSEASWISTSCCRLHDVDAVAADALLDERAVGGVALLQLAVERGFHTS